MSTGEPSIVPAAGRTGKQFKGFQLGSHSAAIHAVLRFGSTPMTLEAIVEATAAVARRRRIRNITQRVQGHLQYWTSRNVYVETRGGWTISPAAQFDTEWAGGVDEAQARNWYTANCQGGG